MRKTALLSLITAMILSSCGNIIPFVKSYYVLPDGGVRPQKPDFSFAKHPYQLTDTGLIDTNVVYLSLYTNVWAGPNHLDSSYHIYRFFGNGRLFISFGYKHKPSDEECTNATYALIGYYKIEGKDITMEIFNTEDYGSYHFTYGYIFEDRIIFTHWKPRGALTFKQNRRPPSVLIKHKVKKLSGRPDW